MVVTARLAVLCLCVALVLHDARAVTYDNCVVISSAYNFTLSWSLVGNGIYLKMQVRFVRATYLHACAVDATHTQMHTHRSTNTDNHAHSP